MADFQVKVINGKSIRNKARVYFTCHPDDFDIYFNKISMDILKAHDCAVFYTEDMAEPLTEENLTLDLERMNLVVVPISLKLLTDENRAMTVDIPYAKEHGIPILPIMMEDGLIEIYSERDKFGELQYISPLTGDSTEIGYATKLENRLLGTLTDDVLAKRVHAVFDTHLFLSYRKRDRAYANKLLEVIHADRRLYDVAVWYDEFLTPGESYVENIDLAMKESDLFLLLVTPNILEDPNFVKDTEYPAAMAAGMTVIPVLAAETDMAKLYEMYGCLPECMELDGRLCERIEEILRPIINPDNNLDPERCFLLGIAYSDGIDVEVDRKRGIELIKYSADAGYEEAVIFIYGMYVNCGNYGAALEYANRYYSACDEKYGDDEAKMMPAVDMLANSYRRNGRFADAIPLFERKYLYLKETLGEDDAETISAMTMLASAKSDAGDYLGALQMHEAIYATQVARYGEKDPVSLISLAELATAYGNAGDYKKAFELKEKSFNLSSEYYGLASKNGLTALNNYAFALVQIGENEQARELFNISYQAHVQVHGEEHPDTLNALSNLAYTTFMAGQTEEGIKLAELVLDTMTRVLGEKHPDTIRSLDNLAYFNKRIGNIDRAIELNERSLALYKSVLGENHPSTATSMNNLGSAYVAKKDYARGIDLLQEAYLLRARLIGEEHPRTVETLELIVRALLGAEAFDQAKDIYPLLIRVYMKTKPAGHPDRCVAFFNLSSCYYAVGDTENAAKYMSHAHSEARIGYGDNHPKTRQYKEILDMLTEN